MPPPDISVVITTFERRGQLSHVLEKLSLQDYPKDRFEVVVVNDGGSQALEGLIERFNSGLQVRLVNQKNAGPAAGRNTGVRHARASVVAFVDDDCEPAPDWLSAFSIAARSHPGALLGGHTLPGLRDDLCSVASQKVQDIVYEYYNADPAAARFFASNNMALSAATFRSLGGFDTRFRIASEDRDLCERWRNAGGWLVYVPSAVIHHSHHMTLAEFARQHFRYGRGASRFHRERARRRSSALSEHTGFHRHWNRWLFRPWRDEPMPKAVVLIMLLLLWQAANAAGFLYGWLFDRD